MQIAVLGVCDAVFASSYISHSFSFDVLMLYLRKSVQIKAFRVVADFISAGSKFVPVFESSPPGQGGGTGRHPCCIDHSLLPRSSHDIHPQEQ